MEKCPDVEDATTIADFVRRHDDLCLVKDGAKVQCKLTKHEMSLRADGINSYLEGRKYTRARAAGLACSGPAAKDFDYSSYPHLIPHKKDKKFLWCTLTMAKVPRDPVAVKKLVEGRHYKKLISDLRKGQEQERNKMTDVDAVLADTDGEDDGGEDDESEA